MTDHLADLTQALLAAARAEGADSADAMALAGTSLSVDLRHGALEQAERAESIEIGLRVVMQGGRQACVSASDTSNHTIAALAQRAVAMAREAPLDPYAGLADPGQLAQSWDLAALELCDDAPEMTAAQLQDMAREVEAAAMGIQGITQVEASAGYGRRGVHLAGSNGFSGGYARSSTSVSAVAFTGQGTQMQRDYAGESRVFAADLPPLPGVGELAAQRALARVGARKPATGTYPVLYDERVASGLIGHLLAAINGAAVARGASWALDALGQPVLPAALSILENPLRPRMAASRPFDGEGLPSAPRKIVDAGVLTGWVLDLSTARQLGMTSTANAARGTSAPPQPATSNIDLTPGAQSQAELLADMGTGLWVTSLIGATINPTTGDYSRGAAGFWVEGGQVQYPVQECTIAGNLRQMLARIIPANDARAHLSTRVPSLLVDGMVLAGA
jgi:PmbA protein